MEGQRALQADVSLYVVHAVVDDVGSRHVKDKACTLSSVPLHNRQRRRKHLHTVGSLGLHASALDAEFAFLCDEVLLPQVADIGDGKPCEAGEDKEVTDDAEILPLNLQVDDALKFFLRDTSRFTLWSLVTVAQERIEVQHTFLYRYADNGLQSRQGTRYAAAFQSAFDGEIILESLDKCFIQL